MEKCYYFLGACKLLNNKISNVIPIKNDDAHVFGLRQYRENGVAFLITFNKETFKPISSTRLEQIPDHWSNDYIESLKLVADLALVNRSYI